MDSHIPDPIRAVDRPLLMPIENVFTIEGRGTVITGKVEQGQVRAGDSVEIVGLAETPRKVVVTRVETFGRVLDVGQAGHNVGCLLRGVARDEVERGQVLATVGSITPHRNFEAEVYVLTKQEGGRHSPFFDGYTPQFFFRTADVTGSTSVLGDAEMAMPGDGVKLGISLQSPRLTAPASQSAKGARASARASSRKCWRNRRQSSPWSEHRARGSFLS